MRWLTTALFFSLSDWVFVQQLIDIVLCMNKKCPILSGFAITVADYLWQLGSKIPQPARRSLFSRVRRLQGTQDWIGVLGVVGQTRDRTNRIGQPPRRDKGVIISCSCWAAIREVARLWGVSFLASQDAALLPIAPRLLILSRWSSVSTSICDRAVVSLCYRYLDPPSTCDFPN